MKGHQVIWERMAPLVLGIKGLFLAAFLSGCGEVEPFAPGIEVIAAPVGELVAVHGGDGFWEVYTPAKKCLGRFMAGHPPVWIKDGMGRSMVYAGEGGLHILRFDDAPSTRLLFSDPSLWPVQALVEGRILLAREEEGSIRGFSVIESSWDEPGGGALECVRIEEGPAVLLRGSPDGLKVSYALRDESAFCIKVLDRFSCDDPFAERISIDDANFPEHFWSPSGSRLVFSSRDGGVELYDFIEEERRWITKGNFAPSIVPFQAHFSAEGARIYLELMDPDGYRQVSTFDIDTGRETRITSGWEDHYAPVLSRDFRFITYRQGDLKEVSLLEFDEGSEESIYVWDFIERKPMHPCDRPMYRDSNLAGPVFSGDNQYLYFRLGGSIIQYPLID